MSIRPIVIAGDPVLHTPAAPVDTIDEEIQALVADMFDTMDAAPGVGLAAPQIGVPLRLFVFNYTDDVEHEWRGVAVNPTLYVTPTPVRDPGDGEEEGCLSFPGERFPLVRSDSALLQATDLDGKTFEHCVNGWVARIFQHEFDHLNGILYVDRLASPYAERARKTLIRTHGKNVSGQTWDPAHQQFDS